jgi:hypothetical protein
MGVGIDDGVGFPGGDHFPAGETGPWARRVTGDLRGDRVRRTFTGSQRCAGAVTSTSGAAARMCGIRTQRSNACGPPRASPVDRVTGRRFRP